VLVHLQPNVDPGEYDVQVTAGHRQPVLHGVYVLAAGHRGFGPGRHISLDRRQRILSVVVVHCLFFCL